MTPDHALDALDEALSLRIEKLFDVLCDAYVEASSAAKTGAQERFNHGLEVHWQAYQFASQSITEKFTIKGEVK